MLQAALREPVGLRLPYCRAAVGTASDRQPATGDATAAGGMALRGAGLLIVRQGLVSLAALAGVIALSGLLSPGDFALYGYATTVLLIAAAVGDLGLGASLIRGPEPKPEHLRGSLAIQLAFWVPLCLLGALAGSALAIYGFSATTATLLCVALLLLALQALPTALLERRMAFGAIAMVEVAQRIVFVGAAVLLAAAVPAQWSIPAAAAIAAAVGYPLVLFRARWRWWPRFHRGEPLFRGFSSHWWQSRIANQLTYATYPLLGGILFTVTEVGWMVWALAITSVPALLSPVVARAVFPATSRLPAERQIPVFRPMFKLLLLAGIPIVAVLVACAQPLTQYAFGAKWLPAVSLLRLESVTTLLGLGLTPTVPLLFLAIAPRTVKWLMVGWLACVVVLTPPLAAVASYRAISIAQIVASVAVLLTVETWLRQRRDYSLLSDMVPGAIGLAVAVGIGLPAAAAVHDLAATVALMAAVAACQLAIAVALGGGVDARALLTRIGPQASPEQPG
jgi:polysaccharide transporter, PST family